MNWKRDIAPWMIVGLLIPACQPTSKQCRDSLLMCSPPYVCNQAGDACTIDHCGNGVHEPALNEVCDDGNTEVCGLCGADCEQVQRLSVATGIIQAVSGNAVVDGETFTLDDGFMELTFELDKGGGVAGGHVKIVVNDDDSADTVAISIATALGNTGLGIIASSNGGEVYLMNRRPGSAGNIAIERHGPDFGIVFIGMAGGAGRDCSVGIGCTSNDDCASRSCDEGVCRP